MCKSRRNNINVIKPDSITKGVKLNSANNFPNILPIIKIKINWCGKHFKHNSKIYRKNTKSVIHSKNKFYMDEHNKNLHSINSY